MFGTMAGATSGLVGPFPPGADPEEYDKVRRRVLWTMPSGLYVIGSSAGGRRNLMTANWVTQVSFDPKLVAVSVEQEALTATLIADGGTFSLSVVDREDRAIVRKFVKPVEYDEASGTLNGFAVHEAATGAPILDQALAYVDCEMRQRLPVGDHVLFVGEVVQAGFQGDEDALPLRMEDTRMSYGG
ncbi:MAG: flavin reductase [Actinobacteria bacterium]|nr:MAG: flavin reductase [Actinomycetota bacterium]